MNKPKLTLLVGPPGSGKSTLRNYLIKNNTGYSYVNQDEQGKEHLKRFYTQLEFGKDNIIVDRMNFDKKQRERYLKPAKEAGYETEIIVLHENFETCFKRCMQRNDHPTIRDEKGAGSALNTFFSKYQRPTDDEADNIIFKYPEHTMKLNAIWIDIDNTLSDAEHREHFMRGAKKNWPGFFSKMSEDPVNEWCKHIIKSMKHSTLIYICSGRPDSYREVTEKWLKDNDIYYDELFMRNRSDSRQDYIIKENILDFDVLTRANLLFAVDDRKQVIDKIRSRGVIVLDCAGEKGNF